MEWVGVSFLGLLCLALNSIADKFSTAKASAVVSSLIKSFFMMISCFIIVLAYGHLGNIVNITLEQWMFIIITGVATSLDWLFYFAAIKRSHLDAFSPMEETSILLCSNVMFSMFFLSSVTNGGKALNIVLYFLGIAALVGAICIIIFNKKINPIKSKKWLIYAFLSSFSYATALLFVKLKLDKVDSDVTSLFVTAIIFVITLIFFIFGKKYKELKTLNMRDYFMFLVAAIFNTGHTIFRYMAISFPNCDPAIVNIIITLNFVLVSLVSCIYFKKKEKLELFSVIGLVCTGMLLNFFAGVV